MNAICPAFIPSTTSRTLSQTIGADLIADTLLRQPGTVLLLAAAAARHISGHVFAVDGGLSSV